MSKVPEISVILPFFNAEDTLEAAVKSILNQTFSNFELLLVDNCSNDKSLSLAKKLAKDDGRICLLTEEKPGVAHAMNCGLRNARGKYLARMDADDISLPERLEKQVAYLKANSDIGLVGSKVKYVSHNKNTAGFKRFVNWVNAFHTSEEIEQNRFIEIPVVNPTILFRKEIYQKCGGCLQGPFPEDYEMQLRYLEAGIEMAKLKEPLLEWHDYSTRLTRTDKRYSTEAFFKIKAKYFAKWSARNNPFHPTIWIWGAGRKTRQRANFLEKEKLCIEGYIDISDSKTTVKKLLHYQQIQGPGEMFIVSMVTNPKAGQQIREYLINNNYKECKDFILMG